jgi:hypothetical protein
MANDPKAYDPRKPYNPRTYYVRPPTYRGYRNQAGQPSPGVFEAGSQYGGNIVKGIVDLMQQRRADQIANEILSKQYGVQNLPQRVGFNWWGQGNQAGGMAELQMRQAQESAELANQIKKAQLADYLAKAAGTGYYAKQPAVMTPFQQKQVEWHLTQEQQKQQEAKAKQFASFQEKNALDAPKLAQSFDKIYGKGSAEQFYNAYTTGTGVRGNIVDGKFIQDPNGEYYTHDATLAAGSETEAKGGFFGWGAQPSQHVAPTVDQFKDPTTGQSSLIKYNELQSYLDKARQIEEAGGKLYPTQYPKELMGPAKRAQPVSGPQPAPAPRATLVNAPPSAAQTTQALPSGVSPEVPVPGELSSGVSPEVPVSSGSETTAKLPTPQTQDDYDAIPSGSDFIDVDGIQKTKT